MVFQRKQCDQVLNLSPDLKLTYFVFKFPEIRYWLKKLDSNYCYDPEKTADLIFPNLAKIFRDLLPSGIFPKSWRTATVILNPKGSTLVLLLHFH